MTDGQSRGSEPPAGGPDGFQCSDCGEWHADVPLDFHADMPAAWSDDLEGVEDCELTSDLCVIRGGEFYIRGLVRLPIVGRADQFVWGVWVSLSEESFDRTVEDWERTGREAAEPMFGWLSTELPVYTESTLGLKTMVHTQPIGSRPLIEIEPTDHPLAVEQRSGLTWAAVTKRVEQLLHS